MKKLLSLMLCLAVVCSFMVSPVDAASNQVMFFDADHDGGVHVEEGFGSLSGLDSEFKTEGTKSIGSFCTYDPNEPDKGIKFAYSCCRDPEANLKGTEYDKTPANFQYDGIAVDLSSFDYIELDIYFFNDWDPIPFKCDFQFALCSTLAAQHGHNYEPGELYFENNKWYHIKMPINEFIVRSPQNKDYYDTAHGIGNDATRYAADLTQVHRFKLMITYITDLNDDPIDQVFMYFDNVQATKEGHTIGETTVMTYEEYLNRQDESSVPSVDDSSVPSVDDSSVPSVVEPSDPSSNVTFDGVYGDLDGNNIVTSADALTCLQFAVDKIDLSDELVIAANVDGAGTVSASDALMILQKSVEAITEFPVEQ